MNTKRLKVMLIAILIAILVVIPSVSNAAFLNTNIFATKKYQDLKNYKSFLNEAKSFANGLNSIESTDVLKIKIIDRVNQLKEKYNKSEVISKISNQIISTTINSNETNSKNFLNIINNTITKLLGTTNLAIESLIPDKTVTNVIANTAGELCGETYKVKLSAKIYYASTDKEGNPSSDKWVYLVQASQMDGQGMADALGQMYLDNGFNVLAPDSRGYGDSDGNVAMGYVESLDVWDWLTYLNNTYKNKCNEVILHGVSLGAATTVFASGLEVNGKTLKDQNVIGLVEDAGYTSLTGIIKGMLSSSTSSSSSSNALVSKILGISKQTNLSSLSKDNLTDDIIKKLLIDVVKVGLTEENFDTYQNALDSLNKSELPILIIHGTSDTIVTYENSTEIYNTAMANDKIPYVQRYVIQNGQHASIILGTNYNVYEGHVHNFIEKSEDVAEGKTVNKRSDYQEETPEKTSIISGLIKALKLLRNQLFK